MSDLADQYYHWLSTVWHGHTTCRSIDSLYIFYLLNTCPKSDNCRVHMLKLWIEQYVNAHHEDHQDVCIAKIILKKTLKKKKKSLCVQI